MNLVDYLESTGTTQDAFAKSVGVTQGAVHQWVTGKLKVTPEKAREIERATGGKVKRMDLRPDIFGPIPKESAAA